MILDLISDFVHDVNDCIECIGFINELLALIKILNIGLIVTLHSNPGTLITKPRGHLGSEICRRAESVLFIKKDSKTGMRTITSSFEFGKNRNASDNIESHFNWNDTEMMFTSCEFNPANNKPQTVLKLEKLAKRIFDKNVSMPYTELWTLIKEELEISERTAKRKISDMENECIIYKKDNRYYIMLSDTNESENEQPF